MCNVVKTAMQNLAGKLKEELFRTGSVLDVSISCPHTLILHWNNCTDCPPTLTKLLLI